MSEKEWPAGPWTVEYNNDTGPNDEGFWEWWSVFAADGTVIVKVESEDYANFLVRQFGTALEYEGVTEEEIAEKTKAARAAILLARGAKP